jgi:hypothetical protein
MSQSVSIPLKGQSREMVYFLVAEIGQFFMLFCSYLLLLKLGALGECLEDDA